MSRDSRFGIAWLLFAAAVALHVTDEATHNFLSFYNPNALMIRERFGIPVPVFTLQSFIISLGAAVLLLLCLSPLAFRGTPWLRRVAVPLAVIVGICNAGWHSAASLYFHRFMPGVYSSPLLFVAAIFLLHAARGFAPKATAGAAAAAS